MKTNISSALVAMVCSIIIMGALVLSGIVSIPTTPSVDEGNDAPPSSPSTTKAESDTSQVMPTPSLLPRNPFSETETPPPEIGETYPLPRPVSPRLGSYGLLPATGVSVVTSKNNANNTVKFDNCTIAFSLPDKKQGSWAVTAGHCGKPGQKVYSQPQGGTFSSATYLGTVFYSSRADVDNGTSDWAVIKLSPTAIHPKHSTRIPLQLDTYPRKKGDKVCKRGSTTGFDCGKQGESDVLTQLGSANKGQVVRAKMSQAYLCALPGDSGSPIYDRNGIIGVLSSTSASPSDISAKRCQAGNIAYYVPISQVIDEMKKHVPSVNFDYTP